MLKKTITYEDFNGETVSEDFFFHLSKSELVKLELSHKGGLTVALQRIIEAEDGKSIMEEFDNIILSAYGKRSDDGKRFVKNSIIREEFASSKAYDELFMQLVTDAGAAAEFIQGIIPADMLQEAAAEMEAVKTPTAPVPEPRVVSKAELEVMPPEVFQEMLPKINSGEVKLGE